MHNCTDVHSDRKDEIQKAIFYILIGTFVTFINGMTIVSYFLRKKSKRTIPDTFIFSLSLSAILTMITVIFGLAFVRATGKVCLDKNDVFCKSQAFFGTQLRMTDVSITTGITIDRFLALYKPLVYRVKVKVRHGKIASVIMWLVSGIVAILPLFGFGSTSTGMESFCTADWTSEISYVVLSLAYLQFGVVLLCYIGIFRAISGLVNRQKAMSRSQTLSYSTVKRPRNKLQKMNAIDYDDVFVGVNNDTMSYTNPNFMEDSIAKTVRELSHENIKSALETVHEGEEYEVKTKVRIKSIERRKLSSNESQYFSTKSETSVDVSVTVNNNNSKKNQSPDLKNAWSDNSQPLDHKETQNDRSPDRIETVHPNESQQDKNEEAFDAHVDQGKKNKLKRTQSCPDVPTVKKVAKFEKAYSESKDYGKVPLGSIGRLKSISIIVKDRFKESRRKKNSSTSSMKNFWAENQRFAKVMSVVVFLFYLSWLPLAVSFFLIVVNEIEIQSVIRYYYNNIQRTMMAIRSDHKIGLWNLNSSP